MRICTCMYIDRHTHTFFDGVTPVFGKVLLFYIIIPIYITYLFNYHLKILMGKATSSLKLLPSSLYIYLALHNHG